MSVFGKPIEEVTERDLQTLIEASVPESRSVEYKLKLPEKTDEGKREFVKDVVSFANAAGGHILYGVEAQAGVPTNLKGIPSAVIDSEILRLEQTLRSSIEPALHGVKFKAIPILNAGENVLAVEIPRGLFGPHMIRGKRAFMTRNSAGTAEMDFGEIRAAFLGAEAFQSRLQDFHAARLSKLLANEGVVEMHLGTMLAVHLLPLRSFGPGFRCDIKPLVRAPEDRGHPLAPFRPALPWSGRLSLDGYCQSVRRNGALIYSHAFHNGAIEYVDCEVFMREDNSVYGVTLEFTILAAVHALMRNFPILGIAGPVFAFASVLNIRGFSLLYAARNERREWKIDADNVFLPSIQIPDALEMLDREFRPSLDVLWHSCGIIESPNFKDGAFVRDWKNPDS